MRWPWRRTSSSGRHALPRQRATWAEPALPPPTGEEAPPAPAYPVRLVFADGSEVGLDARDPSAVALRAVADLLVQDPAI